MFYVGGLRCSVLCEEGRPSRSRRVHASTGDEEFSGAGDSSISQLNPTKYIVNTVSNCMYGVIS